jgi:hypothetical protein
VKIKIQERKGKRERKEKARERRSYETALPSHRMQSNPSFSSLTKRARKLGEDGGDHWYRGEWRSGDWEEAMPGGGVRGREGEEGWSRGEGRWAEGVCCGGFFGSGKVAAECGVSICTVICGEAGVISSDDEFSFDVVCDWEY